MDYKKMPFRSTNFITLHGLVNNIFKADSPLLTAEDIWFKCDLYLRYIPSINLWKICIDLRPFSKYFSEPFLRPLRSPRSNNLEIQNDENSK